MTFRTEHLDPRLGLDATAPFHVASLGLFRSFGSFRWEVVARRLVFHVVHTGEGTFIEDGEVSPVGPGDIYIHRPGRHYRYFDDPGKPWRYDFITFDGTIPADYLPEAARVTAPAQIWPIVRDIEQTCRDGRMTPARAARLAWQCVEAIEPDTAANPSSALFDVLAAIVSRRDAPLPTVGEIARDMGVDRSTLYRRFRAETGGSIKAWLDAQRMARAEDLLRRSSTSVREIAAVCGFRDPEYFSRAFRQAHGMPPGRWRARVQAT